MAPSRNSNGPQRIKYSLTQLFRPQHRFSGLVQTAKLNVLFYAVTCTFIHDKVGQCPVCGGRSSLQKDDLRALLKPSRVTSKQTQHDGPLSHSKNKSRFSTHAFTSILKKWKVNLSKLGNSHYFNPTITRLGGADSFMQFKFTN